MDDRTRMVLEAPTSNLRHRAKEDSLRTTHRHLQVAPRQRAVVQERLRHTHISQVGVQHTGQSV